MGTGETKGGTLMSNKNPVKAAPPAVLPWWKHPRAIKAGQITFAVGALGLVAWFILVFPYVSTDDARVAATMVRLAPRGVGGSVIRVAVDAGDRVTQGQVLVELDHAQAQEDLARAQSRAIVAREDWVRTQNLSAEKAIATRNYDLAKAADQEAQADLESAQIELDDTYLKSPFDGIVVQRTVEVGDILERGQTALSLADIDHAWVSANVEETKVGRVEIGQPVRIQVDAGGELAGQVSEITSASESQFSLIPMENPSGNFIKLVQRIPIKIRLDNHPGVPLKVGESVEIKIKVH